MDTLDTIFSTEGLYSDRSTEMRKPMNPVKKKIIQTNLRKIMSKKSTVATKIPQYQQKIVLKTKAKFAKQSKIKIHYKKEEEYKEFVMETFDEYVDAMKESNSSWFKKNMSFPIMEIDCNIQFKDQVLQFLNSIGESNHMKIVNNDNLPFGMTPPTNNEGGKKEEETTLFPSYFLSHSQGYDNQNMIIRVSIGCSFKFENPFNKPKEEKE